jgi:type IV pilus assembly protein PilV
MIITLKPRRGTSKSQSGIGMVEVLIALLITTIGVLGLVSLQVTGLKSNRSAYIRTQATVLAYDIIDRMRINSDQATTAAYLATPTGTVCTSACTPAQIKDTDILQWNANLASQLPQGTGTITAIAGTTNGYDITVSWVTEANEAVSMVIGAQL